MLGSAIHRADAFQPTSERWLFAWSLLASVLLFSAVAGPFWLGRVYTADDLWGYHLPVRQFYAECLANGDRFDWMPSLYSGFYLTGEGQAGTYHPLHWLLYRCLPLRAAFDLELLLNYPFLLAGAYFFLRRHVRAGAAMFGALVFTFCGFNLLHFVHPNAIAIVAHIPWLLLAINAIVSGARRLPLNDDHRERRGRARLILAEAAVPLLTASQLLLGYPQYVWFSLLAEAVYAVLLWRVQKRCQEPLPLAQKKVPDTFFLRLASLKLLGLLIGAVQLLPTFDALRESQRQAADSEFAQQGALHALNLLQLIGPYLFRDRVVGGNTHEFGLYLGAVPVALIAWMFLRRRDNRCRRRFDRRFAAVALGCAALALWLALGRAGLLYTVQTYLPVIGKFRFPARYLVLVHLALAMAAAAAFADLARTAARARTSVAGDPAPAVSNCGLLWRLTGLTCVVAFAAPWIWGTEFVQPLWLRLVGPALFLVATVLIGRAAGGARWALPALILLTAADLGVYGGSYAIWRGTFTLDTALSTIPDSDGARVATELRDPSQLALRVGNQMVLKGWRQLDGYAGLEPARQLDYRNVNALRVAGVERVLRSPATESIPGLVPLDSRWLRVPNPLPEARFVDRWVESNDAGQKIQQIDVDVTAVVERRPSSPFAGTLPDFQPSVKAVVAKAGRIIVLGECSQPQLLVLTERFHSGWQATVNGTPVDVVRTNGDFLGCITAPTHFVAEFEFLPGSLRYGKLVSAAGLILLSMYCAIRWSAA